VDILSAAAAAAAAALLTQRTEVPMLAMIFTMTSEKWRASKVCTSCYHTVAAAAAAAAAVAAAAGAASAYTSTSDRYHR
jgi:hypothetical protein